MCSEQDRKEIVQVHAVYMKCTLEYADNECPASPVHLHIADQDRLFNLFDIITAWAQYGYTLNHMYFWEESKFVND